ncbi:MAG: branched-chain amino acid ABC transporter permease [Alphaproteobacteria bacterium]|nr:branched-chain amino acid ABC transporter permease [Alphaproteobacteria bacterium]
MTYAGLEPVLIFTLLNVVMVLGLYVTAMSGQLSMATAAIAGVGGYASAVLTVKFGWAFLPAILMASLLSALVGVALALVTLKMRDFILKLTTLAFGEALAVLAFNWDYIGGANSFTGIGLKTTIWTCVIATSVALYVAWRFDGSRLGFAARAVRDDPIAAGAMGVSIAEVRGITFAVGGAVVGMGGAVQGHYMLVISPHELGFFISLNFIIFLLFGGLQTLWGPLFGAILLTALPEMLRFTSEYRLILYGLIITLVVLLRPNGMLTRVPTGREWRLFGYVLTPARPIAPPSAGVKPLPVAATGRPVGQAAAQ